MYVCTYVCMYVCMSPPSPSIHPSIHLSIHQSLERSWLTSARRSTDGCKVDGWMDASWMDGWMDEWMDRWMDGWMDADGRTTGADDGQRANERVRLMDESGRSVGSTRPLRGPCGVAVMLVIARRWSVGLVRPTNDTACCCSCCLSRCSNQPSFAADELRTLPTSFPPRAYRTFG